MHEAAHWYKKAADNKMKEAQFNLGKLFTTGEGVSYDLDQAIKYYDLAASQGLG